MKKKTILLCTFAGISLAIVTINAIRYEKPPSIIGFQRYRKKKPAPKKPPINYEELSKFKKLTKKQQHPFVGVKDDERKIFWEITNRTIFPLKFTSDDGSELVLQKMGDQGRLFRNRKFVIHVENIKTGNVTKIPNVTRHNIEAYATIFGTIDFR